MPAAQQQRCSTCPAQLLNTSAWHHAGAVVRYQQYDMLMAEAVSLCSAATHHHLQAHLALTTAPLPACPWSWHVLLLLQGDAQLGAA
jgi:hypothetical protein